MKQVRVERTFSLAHPIRSAKEFFKPALDEPTRGHSWGLGRGHSVLFAGKITAAVIVASLLLLAPKKTEAKPPLFYKYTSLFAYGLMTPVEGMDGKETNFWVREGGVSYQIPYSLSIGNVSVTPTVMALWGVTRAKGLPPAETNFMKIAITPNITFGEFTLSLGARVIKAWSKEWSLNAGPRTITIPGEAFVDWDFGARGKWELGRETPGFVRSITIDATRFNASGTIRNPYYVYSSSVGLQGGWDFEALEDTRTGKLSVGTSKAWVWNRGEQMLIPGIGYEFGTQSAYYYVVAMTGPVMVMAAYQKEGPDKSYHFLLTVDPVKLAKSVFGSGASQK